MSLFDSIESFVSSTLRGYVPRSHLITNQELYNTNLAFPLYGNNSKADTPGNIQQSTSLARCALFPHIHIYPAMLRINAQNDRKLSNRNVKKVFLSSLYKISLFNLSTTLHHQQHTFWSGATTPQIFSTALPCKTTPSTPGRGAQHPLTNGRWNVLNGSIIQQDFSRTFCTQIK